jgi:hypothetical protein
MGLTLFGRNSLAHYYIMSRCIRQSVLGTQSTKLYAIVLCIYIKHWSIVSGAIIFTVEYLAPVKKTTHFKEADARIFLFCRELRVELEFPEKGGFIFRTARVLSQMFNYCSDFLGHYFPCVLRFTPAQTLFRQVPRENSTKLHNVNIW